MAPKFISSLGPIISQNWLFIVLVVTNVLLYKKYTTTAFHDEAYAKLIYVPRVLRLFALTPLASTTSQFTPIYFRFNALGCKTRAWCNKRLIAYWSDIRKAQKHCVRLFWAATVSVSLLGTIRDAVELENTSPS